MHADRDMPGGEREHEATPGESENPAQAPEGPAGLGAVFDEVYERALASIEDEAERRSVQRGIELLREALGSQPMGRALYGRGASPVGGGGGGAPRAGTFGLIGDATTAGMAALKQVKDLGFVEFTAGLITGTFDAVIGATLKQMDGYAKLVADLAKTLSQFQSENVSDAEINAHLADKYPNGSGGTLITTADFQPTAADPANGITAKTAEEKFQDVVNALIEETKASTKKLVRDAKSQNVPYGLGIPVAPQTPPLKAFTAAQVALIREAIGTLIAGSMMEALRGMAREGMARIVVNDGTILSQLTFNVTATDVQAKQAAKYHTDSAGAYIQGTAGNYWGRVSGGASYQQLNVNTMNESSFDAVTMNAQIIGRVEIHFKTESFAPVVTA